MHPGAMLDRFVLMASFFIFFAPDFSALINRVSEDFVM